LRKIPADEYKIQAEEETPHSRGGKKRGGRGMYRRRNIWVMWRGGTQHMQGRDTRRNKGVGREYIGRGRKLIRFGAFLLFL